MLMYKKWFVVLGCLFGMICFIGPAFGAEDACVACHSKYAPQRFPGLAKGGAKEEHHH